jgi:hypothetical protein
MNDGPLTAAFAEGLENAIRQELVTYKIENGNLTKTSVDRVYFSDRDYIDNQTTVILGQVWEK